MINYINRLIINKQNPWISGINPLWAQQFRILCICLGQVTQLVSSSSCSQKVWGSDFHSGHIPTFWVRFLVGACPGGNWLMDWYFSLTSMCLYLLSFLPKINKHILRWGFKRCVFQLIRFILTHRYKLFNMPSYLINSIWSLNSNIWYQTRTLRLAANAELFGTLQMWQARSSLLRKILCVVHT